MNRIHSLRYDARFETRGRAAIRGVVRAFALTLGVALLAMGAGGCSTAAERRDTGAAAAPEAAPRRYTCYIQIEGLVAGGAIKVNGSQVSTFPGWVTVEVDPAGKSLQRYVVSLSTNITGSDLGAYVINQGDEVPLKIYYERNGPVASGTAIVQGRD